MPTRISSACNGCRSKKQKCSGDKSGCAQCEAAGIPCTWPEQRKRGPAKGYIEGLEHRLHDAESLLLQLLPHVSSEQLQAATLALASHDGNDSGRESPDRRSSPPVLNKKTGIEYWESYPLTSVTGIRRWQQDCEMHGNSSHGASGSIKAEARGSSPGSHLFSSDPARQKRRSFPGQSSGTAYGGPDPTTLDELFGMQNRRASAQPITQPGRMQVTMDQQRNPWTQTMMSMNPSQNDLAQQQMFNHVGYLNTSGQWSQQSSMDIDMSNQDPVTRHQDSAPAVSSQTHSHLFW